MKVSEMAEQEIIELKHRRDVQLHLFSPNLRLEQSSKQSSTGKLSSHHKAYEDDLK